MISNDKSIQKQIEILKHNREAEIIVGSYAEREVVNKTKSHIAAFVSELEYAQKCKSVYEDMVENKNDHSEKTLDGLHYYTEKVEKMVIRINNLSMELIEQEEAYEDAYAKAVSVATENYQNRVNAIVESIKQESQIENE